MSDSLKLLIIGAITDSKAKYGEGDIRERFSGGIMWGGRVGSYLGIDTSAITIGAPDIRGGIEELLNLGVKVHRVPREISTNFSNDYSGETRKMFIRSITEKPLEIGDFPYNLADFNCVILFPLFKELKPEILKLFSDLNMVFLDPSGFLRMVDERNEEGLYPVIQSDWKDIEDYNHLVDILKLSDEDIVNIKFPEGVVTDKEQIAYLYSHGFPLVILTRGGESTLFIGDDLHLKEVPVMKVEKVVDTAGAGEVFAVAFMYKYFLTRDPVESVKFGNICAGLKISGRDYSLKSVEENMN